MQINTHHIIMLLAFLYVSPSAYSDITARELHAAVSECIDDLGDEGRNPELLIEACTIVINSQTVNRYNLVEAYHIRGMGYSILGDLDRAIEDYTRSIELDPGESYPYLNRSNIWMTKGEYEQAMSDINQALKLSPKSAYAYLNRTRLFIEMGKLDEAIEDSARATRYDRSSIFLISSCWTRAIAGKDLKGALSTCNKASRKTRNNVFLHLSRSLVYLRLDRYVDAIQEASEAHRIDPEDASVLFIRGIARIRSGESEAGENDLAVAEDLKPGIDEAFENWGVRP